MVSLPAGKNTAELWPLFWTTPQGHEIWLANCSFTAAKYQISVPRYAS